MTKQAFDKIAAGLREAGDVAAVIAERDAAGATNTRLRAIIGRCAEALGNGAFVGAECSDDFRARLPDEIAAVIASLTRERDEARAIIRETLWMARRYADGRGTYATISYNDAARKALAAGIVEASSGEDEPIWASDMMGPGYAGLSQEEHAAAVAYRARRGGGYGVDELRAALTSARAEVLEEAAQWHEGVAASMRRLSVGQSTAKRPGVAKELGREAVVHDQCASAIRALKEAKG